MELHKAIQTAVRKLSAQGLDDFEVAGISEATLVIEAKQQMVDSVSRTESRGLAMRTVKDGRMAFASTTDVAPHAVELSVEQALGSMRQVAPSKEAVIPPPQEPAGEFAEHLGRTFGEIPDEDKIRMAFLLESAAVAADSRIARVQHPRYIERVRAVNVVNSKGVDVSARRGLVCCELKAVAADGALAESAYDFSFSPRFEDLDVEGTATRAARRAVEKLGGKPVPSGIYPVVFSPRAAAVMVRIAAPSFFADNVQRGKSVLAARRGERVYHPEVSIVDDGLLPGGFGSFPFDGEGIPRRRTLLIRNGVVEGWLYDGAGAARDGVPSTGSSHREGIRRQPSIDVGNCFLKGGDKGPFDLMRLAGEGVLLTDLLGIHTANTVSGDFSLGAEGALIEGGVACAPVRGITIAGNVHELFKNIAGVGGDLKFFWSYGAPSILVEGLMVGS